MDLKRGMLNRRTAVAAGAVALAVGVAAPKRALAAPRAMSQRGMMGGGLARLDGGEAEFSLLGSLILIGEEDPVSIAVGSFKWVEMGSDLVFQSREIIDCRPLPGYEQANTITGRLMLNGKGNYPFLVEVVDAGGPGSGEDILNLYVGAAVPDFTGLEDVPATRFSYVAEGQVEIGDLQFLLIDGDVEIPEVEV